MIRVALLAGGNYTPLGKDFDLYVGIDRGALTLLEQGYSLDWAVGDFDSVSDSEMSQIVLSGAKIYQSPAEKNDTDTELALKLVFRHYPKARVTVFGAFGGRLDHFLANIFLPSDSQIAPYMRQICLVDNRNMVSYLPQGNHVFDAHPQMTYLAFMTDQDTTLTILGAKYDLTAANFFQKKIYSSNEAIGKPISVTVPKGYVVVIESKD